MLGKREITTGYKILYNKEDYKWKVTFTVV